MAEGVAESDLGFFGFLKHHAPETDIWALGLVIFQLVLASPMIAAVVRGHAVRWLAVANGALCAFLWVLTAGTVVGELRDERDALAWVTPEKRPEMERVIRMQRPGIIRSIAVAGATTSGPPLLACVAFAALDARHRRQKS